MKRVMAIATAVMVACVGFAGIASAAPGLTVGGTLAAVDCADGQVTIMISGAPAVIQATDWSAVYVNGSPTTLCSLSAYTGAPAEVRYDPAHSPYLLEQINAEATQLVTEPVQPAPQATVATPSLGTALGALVLGALGHLIGQQ